MYRPGKKCPVCRGDGYVWVAASEEKCAYCRGPGKRPGHDPHRPGSKCPVCDGRGWKEPQPPPTSAPAPPPASVPEQPPASASPPWLQHLLAWVKKWWPWIAGAAVFIGGVLTSLANLATVLSFFGLDSG